MTYKEHRLKWKQCTKCDLCHKRNKVIFARGVIPCDVLFIGEAPGSSEDVIGKPFIGPAGNLLQQIINDAFGTDGPSYAMTNLIGCIPKDRVGAKIEPPPESIKACAPKLLEFFEMAKPKLVVFVGRLALKHAAKSLPLKGVLRSDIIHPAAILRADVSQKGLAIQRTRIILADAVDEMRCSI